MIQYIVVFIIVVFCLGFTIHLFYRVAVGKSSSCSMCDKCDIRRSCADKEEHCEEGKPPTSPPDS